MIEVLAEEFHSSVGSREKFLQFQNPTKWRLFDSSYGRKFQYFLLIDSVYEYVLQMSYTDRFPLYYQYISDILQSYNLNLSIPFQPPYTSPWFLILWAQINDMLVFHDLKDCLRYSVFGKPRYFCYSILD